jgi:hypothetical protein
LRKGVDNKKKMDQVDNFIKCFEETFGFSPPDCEDFKKKEEIVQQPIYKYVEYPENFYIPKNQYELSCQNISIWKKLRYTPYKRISHFREHLNRLQGCQFINIPDKVFQLVQQTLKNHEHESSTQLYYITKETLRKAKFSYYNEHIHHLISQVQKQYLKISYQDYRSLCRIFQELETIFNLKKSATQSEFFKKRKNLISYYLVVQLLLYLFHYHPRYKLPTLYDVIKREGYYRILLGLLQSCSFGPQLLEEHFRRKKLCKYCQNTKLNIVFDHELLKLI